MGLFSLFGGSKKSDDPNAAIHGAGGNPDDRNLHHIGDPRDKAANDDNPYAHWKKGGRVTKKEFEREVLAKLRQEGMSARKREIIKAAGVGFEDADQRTLLGETGMDEREAEGFVDDLRDEASKLNLTKQDIKRLEGAVGDAVND